MTSIVSAFSRFTPFRLPCAPNEEKIIPSMLSCRGFAYDVTPEQKQNESQQIVRKAVKYVKAHPNSRGKINRKKFGGKRSIFIGEDGQAYLLLTRSHKKNDHRIGEGGYKEVKFGINLQTSDRVAVGTVKVKTKENSLFPGSLDEITLTKKETEITNLFKGSERIIQVLAKGEGTTSKGDRRYYIITEYCDGGSLADLIPLREISFEDKKRWTLELLEGLKEIHDKRIIHRDLKPENIFLKTGSDGKLHIKIADLGLACFKTEDEERKKTACSQEWIPPEFSKVLEENPLTQDLFNINDFPRDIFSMGEVVNELFTSTLLYFQGYPTLLSGLSDEIIGSNIDYSQFDEDFTYPNLILNMLKVDPKQRPTIDEAISLLKSPLSQELKDKGAALFKEAREKSFTNESLEGTASLRSIDQVSEFSFS